MQVLKAEHNSQRGSVFALLCGVVAIFAIVNIDKVVAVILTIVHDSWLSEGKVVGRVCVLSCSNCLHGMSAMHSACSLLHYSLPHLIFQTEFLGRFGQAYELSGAWQWAGKGEPWEWGRVYNKNERSTTASVKLLVGMYLPKYHFSACIPSSVVVLLYSHFGFPLPFFSDFCLGTRILLCYNELPRSKWSGG